MAPIISNWCASPPKWTTPCIWSLKVYTLSVSKIETRPVKVSIKEIATPDHDFISVHNSPAIVRLLTQTIIVDMLFWA